MKKILMLTLITLAFNSFAHKLPPEVKAIVDEVASLTGNEAKGRILSNLCTGCHGRNGLPPGPTFSNVPYIADQTPTYTAIQLASYKTGHRKAGAMGAISKRLSSQDISDLIAYYSNYDAKNSHCLNEGAEYNEDEFALGASIAKLKRAIALPSGKITEVSCTMCHGNNGIMPESSRELTKHPDLAGLGSAYVYKQLLSYANGTQEGGPMSMIMKGMTNDELKALATYYSNLKRCR